MEFKTDKPIYLQIAGHAFACILSGEWQAGAKVPSVRETATNMAVNSHTVLRAYEYLESLGVIIARRGMGFYLADDGPQKVMAEKKREFFSATLPEFFNDMDALGIDIEEVVDKYRNP